MTDIRIRRRRGDHGAGRVRYTTGARPAPRAPGLHRTVAALRSARLPETIALRLRITAVGLALLALVVLVLGAPPSITIPIGVVLGTGLAVSAVVALADRLRFAIDGPRPHPEGPHTAPRHERAADGSRAAPAGA
jgi:hypothetical protein